MRHLNLPDLALPLAALVLLFMLADCFSHNLFGGGPEITYSGVDPSTHIPDLTPSENGNPALARGRRSQTEGLTVSEILEQLTTSSHGCAPRLRVLCPSCKRVYVTNGWPSQVRKMTRCAGCNRVGNRFAVRGDRWKNSRVRETT